MSKAHTFIVFVAPRQCASVCANLFRALLSTTKGRSIAAMDTLKSIKKKARATKHRQQRGEKVATLAIDAALQCVFGATDAKAVRQKLNPRLGKPKPKASKKKGKPAD